MVIHRNREKLGTTKRKQSEENPRNNQVRDTFFLGNQGVNNTHVPKEIQNGVSEETFQELSRSNSHILGALTELDVFLRNSYNRVHSGSVPEMSRNANRKKQETKDNFSQDDSHPDVGVSLSQYTQKFSPDEIYYVVTGVLEERLQENRTKRALRVNPSSAVKTSLTQPSFVGSYTVDEPQQLCL